MEQDHKKEIENIIGSFTCLKDFRCYKQGFERLCKAQDVGLETFLECLEEDPHECPFSLPVGGTIYCDCPLRVYLATKLKI